MKNLTLAQKVIWFNASLPMFARRKDMHVMVWYSKEHQEVRMMVEKRMTDTVVKCKFRSIPRQEIEFDEHYYFTLRHVLKQAIDEMLEDLKQEAIEKGTYYEYDYGRG